MFIKSPEDIGKIVRETRKTQGLRQVELAKLCNIGTRFIIDLEKGKSTCQLDKILVVFAALGIKIDLSSPKNINYNYGDGSGFG